MLSRRDIRHINTRSNYPSDQIQFEMVFNQLGLLFVFILTVVAAKLDEPFQQCSRISRF
jgi:hypothetical protein